MMMRTVKAGSQHMACKVNILINAAQLRLVWIIYDLTFPFVHLIISSIKAR